MLVALLLAATAARPTAIREPGVSLEAREQERICLRERKGVGVEACRRALAAPWTRARAAFLWRTLALKLAGLDKWEEAVEAYRQALTLAPGEADLHHRLGAALLYMLQQPAQAEPHLAEAVRLSPGDARAHADRAAALSALGRPEESVAELEEALRLDPGYLDNRPAAREVLEAARGGQAWPAPSP